MVDYSEKIRKARKRIIIVVAIIILGFLFKDKIRSAYADVRLRIAAHQEDKNNQITKDYQDESSANSEIDNDIEKRDEVYIVTESYINIREDAGVDYPSITTAAKGDELIGTGNVKEADNGRPWYEVYLSEDKTDTGWISSKVSTPKEQ